LLSEVLFHDWLPNRLEDGSLGPSIEVELEGACRGTINEDGFTGAIECDALTDRNKNFGPDETYSVYTEFECFVITP